MTPYRVHVRIELVRDLTGEVTIHDTHDHSFEDSEASAHVPYQVVEDAVIRAMASLSGSDPR